MKLALKTLLAERGMSQTALADEIGKTRGYVSLLVRGERTPSADTIARIARALNVTPGTLLDEAPGEHQGFGEQLQPVLSRRLKPGDLAALMTRRPHTPALYEVREGVPAFGYLPGDILVTDLNARPRMGDIVLVNRLAEHGTASTELMRWLEPWLLTADPADAPVRLDEEAAVLAVVVGMARGVRL